MQRASEVSAQIRHSLRVLDCGIVKDHIDLVCKVLSGLGVPVKPPLNESVQRFLAMDPEVQQETLALLLRYILILQTTADLERSGLSTVEIERQRLQAAVDEFGWKIFDTKIFDRIGEEDVVEIYDAQGRQIYRNLLFCRLSSYSLLDVAVHPWQDLYERPEPVIQSLYHDFVEQMSTHQTTLRCKAPKHILREKLDYAPRLKSFLVEMKYLSPLEDPQTRQRMGVITIGSAEEMPGLFKNKVCTLFRD